MRETTRRLLRPAARTWRAALQACTRTAALVAGRQCKVCGRTSIFIGRARLDSHLVEEWRLDTRWCELMAVREGNCCTECGASLRSEQLARALLSHICRDWPQPATSLTALTKDDRFQQLRIAEINTAGHLHKFLAAAPRLMLSSYGSSDPAIPSEDLTNLTYADGSFDLVITSETLEHVPDYRLALREIYRILRPGGAHVFTVPLVIDQPATRQRAALVNGTVEHLFPPTYHGDSAKKHPDFLVFHEFGYDFVAELQYSGFETELLVNEGNPAVTAFVCVKPSQRTDSTAPSLPPDGRPTA